MPLARFPLAEVLTVRVSSYSTARVRDCAYSVPSRLIGAFVQAHVSEATVRFVYRAEEAAVYPRSIGRAPRAGVQLTVVVDGKRIQMTQK